MTTSEINRLTACVTLAAIAVSVPANSPAAEAGSRQPNIIFYMVDDMGWNHIGTDKATMGTHKDFYHTPNIDKLAQGGVSFTHAYQQPNCAPTRAAILSGQYPARVHNDVYNVGSLNRSKMPNLSFRGPEQTEDVAPEAITIAEALNKNGYATAHIGKFHVGGHEGEATLPENVGFDINIGGFSQGHQPNCFAAKTEDGTWDFLRVGRGDFDRFAAPYTKAYVAKRNFPESLIGQAKHISDALGDAMEETVASLHGSGKPFYLQFYTYAVHGPVEARPDLKQAAAARSNGKLSDKMQDYAGFVAGVDLNLGRMLAALNDPNGDGDSSDSIADNTVIIFTSDNGGTGSYDNRPLKGRKGMFTEGGIRVPLVARWPGVFPPDTVTDYKVHSVDYYPTFLELAGGKWLPSDKEHPLDGYSFADVLRKPGIEREREPIFYLFPGYLDRRAQPCVVAIDDVGAKRYKLLYYYESHVPRNGGKKEPPASQWELYCLTDDQEETKNLIESHPQVAERLAQKMHDWLDQEHPTWQPKYPIDKASGKPVRLPQWKR
jgi:arylsulfatase A-like enzyme